MDRSRDLNVSTTDARRDVDGRSLAATFHRKQIAANLAISPATVSRILRRLGLNGYATWSRRAGAPYEREAPGEMIHIDIKKLGRFDKIGPTASPAIAPVRA